ncbi:glycosyltransferase [Parabacteroides pacaensis]|uniref:glycosyltransferase n=1 Tax=Parabacteroides pacaensis TaxID=2086575 RepID=UPI000D0F14B7|nr:glycosyltransferase family A protein [Parabacteroides pacaensis]
MKSILQTYLSRQTTSWLTQAYPVSSRLGMGVVIPCYNEPDLLACLRCLAKAEKPACDVEVLVVVNAPVDASPEAIAQNKKTLEEVSALAKEVNNEHFRIWFLDKILDSGKYAGVGLARRIGMDEMVYRFASIGNEKGLIISLDADCRVDANYFTALEKELYTNKKAIAATMDFEHPLPDAGVEPVLRNAMIQYELYLRYYKHSLKYTGFPYAYYTIGSDFAVKADTYCRAGGMGKYQGGEDFYFLQKVFPLGKIVEIHTTKVYPAARLSDRVPFGTGPSLIKLVGEDRNIKMTYPWKAFQWLCVFIEEREKWFKLPAEEITRMWRKTGRESGDGFETLPVSFLSFLKENRFAEVIEELGNNCASVEIFSRRFFDCFNALRVLQLLNALQEIYPLQPVSQETAYLLKEVYGVEVSADDPFYLLSRMKQYY